MSAHPRFLLLLGPSGVGKSQIIWALRRLDRRFAYISPYTNRSLRPGETDKVFVNDDEMTRMEAAGEFLVVNQIFGFRYATPRQSIPAAFAAGEFPLLDWPIDKLSVMREAFGDQLYVVYVEPPSLEVLAERLQADHRDPDGTRFRAAASELERYWAGMYEGAYDLTVVSAEGQVEELAHRIYSAYLRSLD